MRTDKSIQTRRKRTASEKAGFRLFLLTLPFFCLYFVFSYVPLFGWSYSFFDYQAGFKLRDTPFVGLKYFKIPFSNPILRADILRVIRNTLVMSFLGIATSFMPMLFAVFLSEIHVDWYRRTVQTLTTIPNFISWVLIYAVVWSLFSLNDGFVNNVLIQLGIIEERINFLGTSRHVWITQWAYQMWKGLGWNAIIYISAITSIDTELYEAASIDGAGRFNLMRYITIPGLMPTFFVLLMLSLGNLLNSGMDQYFVFQTAMNKEYIEVLDLYVYNQGIRSNNISYATAVGMLKSIISLILLFSANHLSKIVRGESIF
ncbi:MAG: sugar ABC transporter permease [Clostridia bacterium]|nr:sugar ABC transporter permease [Clostridia bacterium]